MHESVWNMEAERFMSIRHLSQERSLHPALLKLIEECPGERLLDYGCGDGRILMRLSERWKIDAFDPSPQMRQLSRTNLGDRIRNLASDSQELEGKYSVVILGMVILCIPTADEMKRVFQNCAKLMHEGSRLFITTTHPCFRTWRFSNFTTSFVEQQAFKYLKDGTEFEVLLRDPGSEGISFVDYHWSLGFTLGALRSQSLEVLSLVEVPDDPLSPDRNSSVPPFLILECRRSR